MTCRQNYSGKRSWVMWGRSTTGLEGDPASEANQPYNPMLNYESSKPNYEDIAERTFDQLTKKYVYTSQFVPKDVTQRHSFRDPFLLVTFFTHKVVGGSWGAGNTGTITADFTDNDDCDILWEQYHIEDQSGNKNHIDRLVDYLPMRYSWIIEPGRLLAEEVVKKGIRFRDEVHQVNMNTNFHDDAYDRTAVAAVQTIVAIAAASLTDGEYFYLSGNDGSQGENRYYCWFDKVGDQSGDPADSATSDLSRRIAEYGETYTEVRFNISGDTTAQEVSDTITAAINALGDFSAANGAGTSETVTVTGANAGYARKIVDSPDAPTGLTFAVTTEGVGAEGGWANWDNTGLNGTGKRSVKDMVLHLDDAVISGMDIVSFRFDMEVDYETEQTFDKKYHKLYYPSIRNFRLTLEGKASNKDQIEQYERIFSDRTAKTLKIYQDATSGQEKYLQMTQAVVSPESDVVNIPEAGQTANVTLIIDSGESPAVSFSGSYLGLADPSSQITT